MVTNQEVHADLINKLKDPQEADTYFTSILEQCKDLNKEEADELLLNGLKNIAEARPEDVHIDLNKENSLKIRALLRVLRFISKKFM